MTKASYSRTRRREEGDRRAAGIVIPAWNAWEHTRACLESLRPTLGVFDKVVVVDNGSTDGTKAGLKAFGWAEVLTNEQNGGFAKACNQGAALLSQEILVFLNSDTVPVGRWLDELLAPFGDPSVAASGPRSNFVSGPQLLPSARYTNRSELRAFERAWREAHSGQLDEVSRLVGFCLAVRRSTFWAVGGFDEGYSAGGYEDDDLCRRLSGANGRLVIAHGSYVHHTGHASFEANGADWREAELAGRGRFLASLGSTKASSVPANGRPTVSACIIAKDEGANLARCLESLKGVADEVVVGDTGSTDSTVAIAESFGAKVLRVAWEDHFAKARNATLQHCSGDWVLWVDADEEWVGDGKELHDELATADGVDGLLVTISNVEGSGIEVRTNHPAVRLFRRGLQWTGRIHEQVAPADGGHVFTRPARSGSIAHYGYLAEVVQGRDKLERNLRLALIGLEEAHGAGEVARCHLDVGRALYALGRHGEALGHLEEAAGGPEPPVSRMAMHVAARACLSRGDLEQASDWVRGLRRSSQNPLLADILTAEIAYKAGLCEQAVEVAERLELPAYDEDNFLHLPSELAGTLAGCYRSLGRPADATRVVLGAISADGVCPEPLNLLIEDANLAGEPLSKVGAAFPVGSLKLYLAQLLRTGPDDALGVLEGTWLAHPEEKVVLAAASMLAPKASPQAALPWAGRLREKGLPCPLLSVGGDKHRPLPERVLAAAAAARAFGDPEAHGLLRRLASVATGRDLAQLREILSALAPELLGLLPPLEERPSIAHVRPRRRLVSIVVPCRDRAPWTLRLLKSLQETLPEGGYELVIVDNGSTDATSRATSNFERGVVVVRNGRNLGFSVACNQGARAASGEVLLLCRNDVVAKPGWLPPLLEALALPRVGVAGPKLVSADGALQHAGIGIFHDADGEGYLDGAYFFHGQRADHPLANRAKELRSVTGDVMATRRRLFLDLGGFDEGYRDGNADIDFCLRAGEAGYRVWYEPASALVLNERGPGRGGRFKQAAPDRLRLTERWAAKVLDERETGGVVVVGPFGAETEAGHLAQRLVALADEADVPVVTRSWPDGEQSWCHRLGPGQQIVLSVLEPAETEAYLAADAAWLPAGVRVLAGREALEAGGLLGEWAAKALSELTRGARRPLRSSWRAKRADCTVGPKEGL